MKNRSMGIALAAILTSLTLLGRGDAQVIERELRERAVAKITIALAGFAPFQLNGGDAGKLANDILTADLKFTTVFDVME
ncbi:MAG TPA: hypothetical protein VMG58_00470, partial [Candidatus Sulfotelmatobacter sp.]|nr:hypothetical protein [Candidatus Sulfotelmatobacter sp.]